VSPSSVTGIDCSVDGPRLPSLVVDVPDEPELPEDPDDPEDPEEPDEPEDPDELELEDPDDPEDPELLGVTGVGLDEPDGTGEAGTGEGPDAVDGAEALGVELVLGGDVVVAAGGFGAAAAGAGAGGAGGAARTGGGFSATVTLPGPSSEMATNATAVEVMKNARTTPTMIAGPRRPLPERASLVPHCRHQSWSGSTEAPQVAQVLPPSGAS